MADDSDDSCGDTDGPQAAADSERSDSIQKKPFHGQLVSPSCKLEASTSPPSPPSSPDGSSTLKDALLKRDRKEVKRILQAGVSPNSVNWKGLLTDLPVSTCTATLVVSFVDKLPCLVTPPNYRTVWFQYRM